MKTRISKAVYLSPKVKVTPLKSRAVFCQSGLQNYQEGDDIDFDVEENDEGTI